MRRLEVHSGNFVAKANPTVPARITMNEYVNKNIENGCISITRPPKIMAVVIGSQIPTRQMPRFFFGLEFDVLEFSGGVVLIFESPQR